MVGGGTLVGLSPLAVLVPLLATVLVALAERCRGILATLVALGAGQLGLHYLLLVLTTHGHQAPAAFPATTMVAAHAAATLATAVVVAHADAMVTALVAALRRIRPRRPRVGAVDVAPPARPVPDLAVPLAHEPRPRRRARPARASDRLLSPLPPPSAPAAPSRPHLGESLP